VKRGGHSPRWAAEPQEAIARAGLQSQRERDTYVSYTFLCTVFLCPKCSLALATYVLVCVCARAWQPSLTQFNI
jgi:hypothetical protein